MEVIQIKNISKPITIPLLVISLIVEIFLLVDGSYFFQNWSEYQQVIIIYLLISASLLGVSKQQFFDISFFDAMIYFVPAFLITALIIGQTVRPLAGVTNTASYEALQILLQIFVVSITEELFFRGFVQNYLGWIIQAPVFALFHLVAYTSLYGIDLYAFFTALIMGLIFGYIVKIFSEKNKKSTGLAITWGMHAGWNVAIATGMFYLMGVI